MSDLPGADPSSSHDRSPDPLESLLAECLEQWERGGQDALDTVLARHPNDADALRDRIDRLHKAGLMPDEPGIATHADVPEQIGPYRILGQIGEGGMGTVYHAEQRQPIRREVALKVVKRGMDTKEVLARFALERRALAAMSHRCIARVLDAGETERGEPYFVMEFVQGQPLAAYCDQHRLSIEERLKLFQLVCAGVQHAHQRGIVHRDLKPGNVLVHREGDAHLPKILDFGLAKATDRDFLDASIYTEQNRVLGTPEYMAPEQAAGKGEIIDTRADVYSLGVILYELLSGQRPFSSVELREAGFRGALALICEQEPPKPSTKLLREPESGSSYAQRCRSSLVALSRALKGDLDWVVLRAIEKEPDRRYDSANALAMEVQRYLDHEPVLAGPPSASYRLKKLLRRYRTQAIGVAAVFVALLAGGTTTFVNFRKAEANAADARSNEEKARRNAADAEQQRLIADRRADRLAEMTREAEANADQARQNATKFKARTEEFNMLAGVVIHERAKSDAETLFPSWPDKIEAMQSWLAGDVRRLNELRPGIEATLQALRDRALPQTEAERAADRLLHPRFSEWQRSEAEVASLLAAARVRAGGEPRADQLSASLAAANPATLHEFAWKRVAPQTHERERFGEEAMALAAAEAAVEKSREAQDIRVFQYLNTLAWSRFAMGLDQLALEASREALSAAPETVQVAFTSYLTRLTKAIEASATTLEERQAAHDALSDLVRERQTWTFESEEDRFLFTTLSTLLERIDSLEGELVAEVQNNRMRWASHLRDLEQSEDWQKAWSRAAAEVAASDKYAGFPIPSLKPQSGLWPMGTNPATGLQEFYHLRSAWDGTEDPSTIEIPAHDPSTGFVEVGKNTGIVFTLIPGGNATIGAQKEDPNGAHYYSNAAIDEAPITLTLTPYLMARHELTQGQWKRLCFSGQNPAPSQLRPGMITRGMKKPVAWDHPAENVDWDMCTRLLQRHGLDLPTEAQWEHGCRAGTVTAWTSGDKVTSLEGFANVLDQRAKMYGEWDGEYANWDDGFLLHAPVDALDSNAWGLHHVHGNVLEWCLDQYGRSYQGLRTGDGLQQEPNGSGYRVYRGGGFYYSAGDSRSSFRLSNAPPITSYDLGARPARVITGLFTAPRSPR